MTRPIHCPLMFRKPAIGCAIVCFALAAESVHATATFLNGYSGSATELNSSTETAYEADASDSDLIHNLAPTAGSFTEGTSTTAAGIWRTSNGANITELNDGIHGVNFAAAGNTVEGAWANREATATYDLGSGANGSGYDITTVQSFAAWQGAGFGNQAWTLAVQPAGGGAFVDVVTVNYQPFGAVGGATKVSLTGLNITGIQALRVTTIAVNNGTNAGSFVWRELDVFGAPTDGESPLVIDGLSPEDGASGVEPSANLEATFSRNIVLGSGAITIRDLDKATDTVINLPDAQVSVSGKVLTIDPASDLAIGTRYAIRIGATAIQDGTGAAFAGIPDDTTWNFNTGIAPLRIMCLGDSITVGYTNADWSGGSWEHGYRSGLFTRLSAADYRFLFVGSSTEPESFRNPETTDPAYPPAIDLNALGQAAHNGYASKTVSYLNSNILTWLADNDPDIILLKIGTNSQDPSGLHTLVNTITSTRPEVHLIIAEIMPKYDYQQGIVDYNNYIRETLVPNYQGQGKKVTLADQYAPFLTNPSDPSSIDQSLFSNGINHPNNPGYDKMAQVWFEAIQALGLGPNTFGSYISNPDFGLDTTEQGFTDDPDNDRVPNGLEAWFGTHPGEFSTGIAGLAMNGATTSFTHPKNANPPEDLDGFYQWSPNLLDWYDCDGTDGPVGGPTVSVEDSTFGETTTVLATASESLPHLFLRVGVNKN